MIPCFFKYRGSSEAVQRAFFWYDPATNTSQFADKLNNYQQGNGLSKVEPMSYHAPADSWMASIGETGSDEYYTYWKGRSANPARLLLNPQPADVSGFFPAGTMTKLPKGIAWDAVAGNLLFLVRQVTPFQIEERRYDATGANISTVNATFNGSSTYTSKYPDVLVQHNDQWHAFSRGTGVANYYKRDTGSANWVDQLGFAPPHPSPDYGYQGVIAAGSLGTVLIALVDNTNSDATYQPCRLQVMRSTDNGATWNTVGGTIFLNNADGMTTSYGEAGRSLAVGGARGATNNMAIRIGNTMGYYFSVEGTGGTGPGIYVLKSNSDGTTWTISKVTVDGADWTASQQMYNFCSNIDGSCIVATRRTNDGTALCQCYMMKSTDGINFTTIPDSAIFVPGYADQPTDYKPVPNSTFGDVRSPVLSSGTKFLFERVLQKTA